MRRVGPGGAAVVGGGGVAVSARACGPGPGRASAGSPNVAGGQPAPVSASQLDHSVAGALSFLNLMMDRYAAGSTPRLVQSFTGGVLGQQGFTSSVTYDDALVIDAYLAEGTRAGRARAEAIGDGLLYVQAHDPAHDGRIRAAYAPRPLLSPGDVDATDPATLAGNMAWAGQSLVQLYAATGRAAYLAGAEAIGDRKS